MKMWPVWGWFVQAPFLPFCSGGTGAAFTQGQAWKLLSLQASVWVARGSEKHIINRKLQPRPKCSLAKGWRKTTFLSIYKMQLGWRENFPEYLVSVNAFIKTSINPLSLRTNVKNNRWISVYFLLVWVKMAFWGSRPPLWGMVRVDEEKEFGMRKETLPGRSHYSRCWCWHWSQKTHTHTQKNNNKTPPKIKTTPNLLGKDLKIFPTHHAEAAGKKYHCT